MIRRALGIVLLVLATVVPGVASAEGCTLLRLQSAKGADLIVYFTKFEKEDKTGGRYRTCRVVKKAEPGTKRFWITPFRQDANVIVHPKNWPR